MSEIYIIYRHRKGEWRGASLYVARKRPLPTTEQYTITLAIAVAYLRAGLAEHMALSTLSGLVDQHNPL